MSTNTTPDQEISARAYRVTATITATALMLIPADEDGIAADEYAAAMLDFGDFTPDETEGFQVVSAERDESMDETGEAGMTMRVETRPVATIAVNDRARKGVGDLTELTESMRELGLISPIVITRDGTLIAGERRLRAAEALGWAGIDCRIWRSDADNAELLKAEIHENTCRKQLTPAEAERAWQRLKELYGLRKGSAGRVAVRGDGVLQTPSNRELAQATGYGPVTLGRVQAVREAAEDGTQPGAVREVAREEYAKLSASGASAQGAHERVKAAKRKSSAASSRITTDPAAMLPGQWLASDKPKPPQPEAAWADRLWRAVRDGKDLGRIADELEAEPGTSSVSAKDLDDLAQALRRQITERQRLRGVLLAIRKEKNT